MDALIGSVTALSESQTRLLSQAGITRASDLWLYAPADLARKMKVAVEEVQVMIDAVCKATAPKVRLLSTYVDTGPTRFTTGDMMLDKALAGGIHTGAITEISGESSSGKTQLALQLALTAQLSPSDAGLNAGVAYFTTTSYLSVRRLTELAAAHPVLCSHPAKTFTDNVHTCSVTTIPALLSALKNALPQLCSQASSSGDKLKPIRVLIIDSLGSLFHSLDKTTTTTLAERSKVLGEIGQILHGFASAHEAAVIVLNQVVDVFQPMNEHSTSTIPSQGEQDSFTPELLYREQTIWFNRAPSADYHAREATLGLVWANLLNTRLMLSRTRRRQRPSGSNEEANKRRKGVNGTAVKGAQLLAFAQYFDLEEEIEAEMESGVAIRKLAITFSAHCAPCLLEFIIVKEGVQVVGVEGPNRNQMLTARVQTAKGKERTPTGDQEPAVQPPSPNFISARLTQAVVNAEDELPVKVPAAAGTNAAPVGTRKPDGDFFDFFDEIEWNVYDTALGDTEEQWDAPDLDNQAEAVSEPDEAGDDIVETSDVEENLILNGIVALSQKVLVLEAEKG